MRTNGRIDHISSHSAADGKRDRCRLLEGDVGSGEVPLNFSFAL